MKIRYGLPIELIISGIYPIRKIWPCDCGYWSFQTTENFFRYFFIIRYFQTEKEIEYQLFRLYYNENDIQYYEGELVKKKKEVEKIEKKKESAEEVLKEKKKDQGKVNRDLAKIDQEIREVVS